MVARALKFDAAREAVLQAAEQLKFPEVEKMKKRLAMDVPSEQFAALQEFLRALASHADMEALVSISPIFQKRFSPEASVERQKAQVRSLSNDVHDFLTQLTGKDNNGGKRRRYTEPQWLRIVYAPQLRHRLKDMWTPCLGLEPPVDLKDEERYPHNQAKAEELFEQMEETEFFTMFTELQRAATHFFQCPQLEEAKRLNESLADVRRRKLGLGYMAYFPKNETALPRLLAMGDDNKRLQTIMTDNEVTGPLVEAALEAYRRLVAEHLAPAAEKITLCHPARSSNGTAGTIQQEEGDDTMDETQLRMIVSEILGQKIDPLLQKIAQLEQQVLQVPADQLRKLASLADKAPVVEEKMLDEKMAAQATKIENKVVEGFNNLTQNVVPDLVQQLKLAAAQGGQPPAAAAPGAPAAVTPQVWYKKWQTWAIAGAVLLAIIAIASLGGGSAPPLPSVDLILQQ